MSIVVSVKVRDGIVLGADSLSQIYTVDEHGNPVVAKTYANARKLFEISDLPMGAMTWGAGNIGNRSLQGLLLDFGSKINKTSIEEKDTVRKVIEKLLQDLKNEYDTKFKDVPENKRPLLGVFVCGYSTNEPLPEEWEFQLPKNATVKPVRSKEMYGASWRGVSIPFTRLLRGFDPRIRESLKKLGVSEEIINKSLEKWKSPIAYDGMPVQDAINFAYHILRTTVAHTTFEVGAPSCGAPFDVAAILPDSGFQWVTERKLTLQEL